MGESCEYHVAGYNYAGSGGWNSCMAVCVAKAGTAHANLPVRFGHDGTKCVVCIGEVNTLWNHPVAQVHDIVVGYHSSDFNTWKSGWNVTIGTALPSTINQTITNTHVAYGGVAVSAATATKAIQDGNGNNIVNTYAKKSDISKVWKRAGVVPNRGGSLTIETKREIKVLAYLEDTDGNCTIKDCFDVPTTTFSHLGNALKLIRDLGSGDQIVLRDYGSEIEITNACYAYDILVFTR